MLSSTLKISHNPEPHVSYVKSWIKVLKDDPKEILYAAKDADKIHSYVMEFDRDKTIETTESFTEKAIGLSKKPMVEEEKGNKEMASRFKTLEEQSRFIETVNSKIAEQPRQVSAKEESNVTQEADLER